MPTLAEIEETLVGPAPDARAGLVGLPLASVGIDVTGESPVAALAPAISQALLECGVTPANILAPADSDFAGLSGTNVFKFLDIASLLLLEQAAAGQLGQVKTISWDDYSKTYFGPEALKDRREYIRRRWGWGGGKLTAGWVDYGFATRDPNQTTAIYPWN